MKKLIAMLLALTLVLSFAACGRTNDAQEPAAEPEASETVEAESALAVLETVYALYTDAEKFPIMGGNPEGGIMDQPGVWDPALLENLTYTTQLPMEQVENVAEAATMIHMMNANTFTAAVYGLAEGVDAAAFAQAMVEAVHNAQWMCGIPEQLEVALVGGYVLVAYGHGDAMTPFRAHLAEAFAGAETVFSGEAVPA